MTRQSPRFHSEEQNELAKAFQIARKGLANLSEPIEGCTEITMLVGQEHTDVPLFDTTAIHAREAVAEALR